MNEVLPRLIDLIRAVGFALPAAQTIPTSWKAAVGMESAYRLTILSSFSGLSRVIR